MSRYFEDDDDDHHGGGDLEYLPAPGSPSLNQKTGASKDSDADDDSSDSDDPLESFMAGIDVSLLPFFKLRFWLLFVNECFIWHIYSLSSALSFSSTIVF